MENAKETLRGEWLKFIALYFIINVVLCALSFISPVPFLVSVLSVLVNASVTYLVFDLSNGYEFDLKGSILEIRQYLNAIVGSILYGLIWVPFFIMWFGFLMLVMFDLIVNFLPTLGAMPVHVDTLSVFNNPIVLAVIFVLNVISIIVGIIYSQWFYVVITNNHINCIQAFKISRLLMKGHLSQLFLLNLKFVILSILCIPTFGIGFLFLVPYVNVSYVEFYKALLDANEDVVVEFDLEE